MSGPDMSVLTGAVDFIPAVAAVLTVACALGFVYVAQKGIRMILDAIRGDAIDLADYDPGFTQADFERMNPEDRAAYGFKSVDDMNKYFGGGWRKL